MNIAIYSSDFTWAGGVDFLHLIVKGLSVQKRRECRIFLLVYKPSRLNIRNIPRETLYKAKLAVRSFRSFGGETSSNGESSQLSKTDDAFNFIDGIDEIFSKEKVEIIFYDDRSKDGLAKVLKKIRADIVLPVLNNIFPENFNTPWIGYLFDFVHKYHSYLYSNDFCLSTDIKYATTLKNAKAVVVNSEATKRDIEKYFPYSKAKVFKLPFAPFNNEILYNKAVSKVSILDQYGIGEKFFLISNQFWLHKSHETAFKALKILVESSEFKGVNIVCTGRMTDLSGTDNRRVELLEVIRELGLQNNITFLGHISKVDQLALMLRSAAVIQPTLFEGGPGGGSVYTAVANGVPVIVSDIPVNLEIGDNPLVTYFATLDEEDLMQKMKTHLKAQKREFLPVHLLMKNNSKKLETVGHTILSCIEFTICNYSKKV